MHNQSEFWHHINKENEAILFTHAVQTASCCSCQMKEARTGETLSRNHLMLKFFVIRIAACRLQQNCIPLSVSVVLLQELCSVSFGWFSAFKADTSWENGYVISWEKGHVISQKARKVHMLQNFESPNHQPIWLLNRQKTITLLKIQSQLLRAGWYRP